MKTLKDYECFRTENGVLYCGDNTEILPLITDEIDLCLTDPPYGIGFKTKNAKNSIGKKREEKRNYDTFKDTYDNFLNNIIPVINIITQKYSCVITPGSINFMDYPEPNAFGCLFFPATCSVHNWGFADGQPIFYYGKNPRKKNTGKCSFKVTEKPSCKEHPCAKPQKVWEEIIFNNSLNNQTVLDPFFGSGTTALACEKLNRKWIGIEISEKYCEIAKKRVEEYTSQLKLFK